MTRIAFTVQGESRPAGSKTAMPSWNRKTQDFQRGPDGRIITRVFHAKTKTKEPTKDYMQRVGAAAREVYDGPLLEGPLILSLRFYRARPKGHYGTGRNAGKIKPSAPRSPIKVPDLTKLTRAIEDGLTKVIWRDDAQVCRLDATKAFGTHHYVEVEIMTIEGDLQHEGESDG